MIEFVANEFIKESQTWHDCGTFRKVVFKKGLYRAVTIYTREQCSRREDSDWKVKILEYSFDREYWTDDWIYIRREIKKRGL